MNLIISISWPSPQYSGELYVFGVVYIFFVALFGGDETKLLCDGWCFEDSMLSALSKLK